MGNHIYENNRNNCSICNYMRPQTEETKEEDNTSGIENEDAVTQ